MLTLGISTSSGQFALALGESGTVINDPKRANEYNELDEMLSDALTSCKRELKEISAIIIDIGPGGTSRVRTGVAFANSVSYALNIPVYPVSSIYLAGIDAWSRYQLPVVVTMKSIKENAYVGLYHEGAISVEYGRIEAIVPKITAGVDKFVVVGFHREAIIGLPALVGKSIIDSQMLFGDVKLFVEREELFRAGGGLCFPDFAQPITENVL